MRLKYGWKLWTAVVLLFLAGMLVGASGARYYFFETHHFMRPPDSPQHAYDQVLERMRTKLNLRQDQYEAISKFVQEAMEKGRVIMDQIEPQMAANIQEQYEKIMSVLNPDQQKEFTKMHKRFERHRKKFRRPPPPDHPVE